MYPVISRQSYPGGATIVVTVGSLAFYKTRNFQNRKYYSYTHIICMLYEIFFVIFEAPFLLPTLSCTNSFRPISSKPLWKYSATSLCRFHEFSRPYKKYASNKCLFTIFTFLQELQGLDYLMIF